MERTLIRQATLADIPRLQELEEACYPTLSTVSRWKPELLASHQRHFPEGQMVADHGGRLVGHSACFITRSEEALKPHVFRDITARGTFDTHDPKGDVLYGAEIMVHPEFRRRGLGKRFYRARLGLARRLGLRYFAAGGRIPEFKKHAGKIKAEDYVRAVIMGVRTDRTLTAQLRSGLKVMGVMPNYMNDPSSGGFATLLVWENPDLVEDAAPPVASGRGEA